MTECIFNAVLVDEFRELQLSEEGRGFSFGPRFFSAFPALILGLDVCLRHHEAKSDRIN